MWELDHKESWMPKNWCFQTVVLEKTLESPLDSKEIKPVHPKENQSWMFIEKTDAEAETPKLWPPDVKNGLIWKHPDARKDWRLEEKEMTEDVMVWWYHLLDGHEFEQALGVGDRQGSLACCSPLDCRESDRTERLNWTDLCLFQSQLIHTEILGSYNAEAKLEGFWTLPSWWFGGLVAKSCPFLATPWTVTCQAPLSI